LSSTRIERVVARKLWDSRGLPTVEVEVQLASRAAVGRALAPAGASVGSREAIDLRDGGRAFGGKGVDTAITGIIEEIAPLLCGLDAVDQSAIDGALVALDGTAKKARLGGNAIIATSMAVAHAAAQAHGCPLWQYLAGDRDIRLPMPEIQIFGGGAHAGRRVDVQDFMIVPVGATDFAQALAWTAEVYRAAGQLMSEASLLQGVADEGGYWPAFQTNEQALDMLMKAIERAGFHPCEQIAISLDIAASELGRNGRYKLALDGRELSSDEMASYWHEWLARYPIVAIEDPLAEDDPEGLARFTKTAGKVAVIGDDFLVTNADRIQTAIEQGACNAVLVKPNQAGTLTETKAAYDIAVDAGWTAIISARSGETEDVTIVHLAVGWGAPMLKVGSFARSERMAKWNEALRIAEVIPNRGELVSKAHLPWGK
jgi:enolase